MISPHFDDAVLSCGHFLARNPGVVVATICGGIAPAGLSASPSWDHYGWKSARDATMGRCQEDIEALECLNAVQMRADLLDEPYRRSDDDASVFSTAIGEIIDQVDPHRIAIPLAAGTHLDHTLTRDGALTVLKARGLTNVFFYADLPYFAGRETAQIAQELNAIAVPRIAANDRERALKREALTKYRSQMPLLRKSYGRFLKSVLSPNAERLYRYQPN